MDATQSLYYGLGQMCYAIAKSDGDVQNQELEKVRQIVAEKTANHQLDFDVSEIIFRVLDNENMDVENAYEWSIKEIKNHKYKLTEEMKKDFISTVQKVADAFPPITQKEKDIIEKFKHELNTL